MAKARSTETITSPSQYDPLVDIEALAKRLGTLERTMGELQTMVADLKRSSGASDGLAERVARIEAQQGELARHVPRSRQRMTKDEVAERCKDPTAKFEVLEPYERGRVRFRRGQHISSQHHGELPAHVGCGLALAPAAPS